MRRKTLWLLSGMLSMLMLLQVVVHAAGVTTDSYSNVTKNSADLNGTVYVYGAETVTSRGFYYGTDPNLIVDGNAPYLTYTDASTGAGAFSGSISGLSPSTTYYFKAFANGSSAYGNGYGTTLSFTTAAAQVPVLSAVTPTSPTSSGVTLTSDVTQSNGGAVTERGFMYSLAQPSTANDFANGTKKSSTGTLGTMTETLTGLLPGTIYYVWAYAVNADGLGYSAAVQITTAADKPAVTTGTHTPTASGATVTGTVVADGGDTITERGFLYSTTDIASPTVGDLSTNPTKQSAGGVGAMSETLTGLQPNTIYYVWAYAKNSVGTAFGSKTQFRTSVALPSLAALVYHSNVTSSGVDLSGTVNSDGGDVLVEQGFLYSTTDLTPTEANLTDNTPKQPGQIAAGTITGSLSGLLPNTTYYVWAYAKNSAGASFSGKLAITTSIALPAVTTGTHTPTASGATVTGTVVADGGDTITERGFLYSTTDIASPTVGDLGTNPTKQSAGGVGAMSETLTGLQPNTIYYVWAYAKNSVGTAFGSKTQFRTSVALPSLAALVYHSNVTSSGVDLSGTVNSDGGDVLEEQGFLYSTTDLTPTEANLTDNTPKRLGQIAAGTITGSLSSLLPNTTYYVWAYAKNSAGTSFSGKLAITTSIALPAVTTGTHTPTASGATVTGTVVADGGDTITERGFLYSTTDIASPTVGDLGTNPTKQSAGGVGAMSETLTGLQPNTIYYVWAYAKNSVGTAFGSKTQFRTSVALPSLAALVYHSNVTSSGVDLSGTVNSDGGDVLEEQGFLYSTTDLTPTEANLTDNTPKQLGQIAAGTITGSLSSLLPNTTYYVWAYAKNSAGASFSGKLAITTDAEAPVVTTAAATGITLTGATVPGHVTSDGGLPITEYGVVYSLESNPIYGTALKSAHSGSVSGSFSEVLTGLQENTKYYARAYAINSKGISYGTEIEFRTKALSGVAILTGIATSNLTLSPSVSSQTYAYTAYVDNVIDGFELTPGLDGTAATVRITVSVNGSPVGAPITISSNQNSGTIPLTVGTTVIKIDTIAENGTVTGSYTLTVDRAAEEIPPAGEGGPTGGASDNSTGSSTGSSITVKVINPDTGAQVNARITEMIGPELALSGQLRKADGTSLNLPDIKLNANGTFTLPNIPAGEYKLLLHVIAPTGEKLAGQIAKLTVGSDGTAVLEAKLIDPYGTITDAVSGHVIEGVRATLHWNDTELNKSKGRNAGEQVLLPELPDFPPNNNHNPQTSSKDGEYGWMVFPDGDYYIVATREGYEPYDSRKDKREQKFGDDSIVRDGNIHVGVTIVEHSIKMQPVSSNHQPYMEGYENGEFRPDGSMTRAELATILSRVLPTAGAADDQAPTFSDTSAHWASAAIAKASVNGWVTGYPSGEFAPDQALTRAEFAQVLYNFKKWSPAASSKFSDVAGHWGLPAIGAAESEGLLSGYPDGTFLPDKQVTRAEAVKVFNKLLDRKPHLLNPNPVWSDVPATYWGFADIIEASVPH